MKTVLAVLFATVYGAACTAADGTGDAGGIDGTKALKAACKCGELADDCPKDSFCFKGAILSVCGTAAFTAPSQCAKIDGSAASTTAHCVCNAKTEDALPTDKATWNLCVKDETCDASKAKAAEICAPKAGSGGNSASMITAFATIMTTAFFSF